MKRAERDVEVIKSRGKFVATLRRLADALERAEPLRIQIAGKRISVPPSARLSIEHEADDAEVEVELQLTWQLDEDEPAKPAPRRKKAAKRG